MKKNIQQIMKYYFDESDEIKQEKSSFASLEKAIENAEMFIYRKEDWIDSNVVSVEIINKESKEVLWSYNKVEA